MVKIELTAYLKGDNLSEKDIEKHTGIIFHSIKEYEKLKLPIKTYTKVISIVPEENNIFSDDYNILIKNFSDFFNDKVEIIKKFGCDKIVLLVVVNYENQCNLSFDNDTIKSISSSFDDFDISCYEVEKL